DVDLVPRGRGVIVRLGAHGGGELAHALERGAQRRALRHFTLDLDARRGVELAVEIGAEGLVVGLHLCSRSRGAGADSVSFSASMRRARARRDMTVPIGTSAMCAICL